MNRQPNEPSGLVPIAPVVQRTLRSLRPGAEPQRKDSLEVPESLRWTAEVGPPSTTGSALDLSDLDSKPVIEADARRKVEDLDSLLRELGVDDPETRAEMLTDYALIEATHRPIALLRTIADLASRE